MATSSDLQLRTERRRALLDQHSEHPFRTTWGRPLPAGSAALLESYGAHDAVYLSTPITTGKALAEWLVREADTDPPLANFRDSNLAAATLVHSRIRRKFPDRLIIDPTRLADQDSWEQIDYHRFWVEVLVRNVSDVVFAPDWQYSVGCAIELGVAVTCGIKAHDDQLLPLGPQQAAERLNEALPLLRRSGAGERVHEAALSAIVMSGKVA